MTRSLLLLATLASITTSSNAQQTGDLDPTFGVSGVVFTDFQGENDLSWDGVIQPDGKIVAVGQTWINAVRHFSLARYMPNGDLDTSFGTGGLVTTLVGTWGEAKAVALQPDGRIVVAGSWKESLGDFGVVAARYTADGALDASFDGDGFFALNPTTGIDGFEDIAIQPDGKVLLVGRGVSIIRLNPDGTPDISFGGDGTADLTGATVGGGDAIVLQPDGYIVLVGRASMSPYNGVGMARLAPDGTLDTTFGTGGSMAVHIGPLDDHPRAAALQPDGKIVVCGQSDYPNHLFVARFNSDGALDNSFSGGGYFSHPSGAIGYLEDVVVLPDGRIAVTGFTMVDDIVVLFHPDGTLDATFGGDGMLEIEQQIMSGCKWIEVQNDGKLVVGGVYSPADPSLNDFALIRLWMDLNVGLIEFTSADAAPLFYPNPIAQSATLRYTLAAEERITITLVDLEGRTVQHFLGNALQQAGEQRMDLAFDATVAPGTYLLTINSAEGSKVSVQVTKQ